MRCECDATGGFTVGRRGLSRTVSVQSHSAGSGLQGATKTSVGAARDSESKYQWVRGHLYGTRTSDGLNVCFQCDLDWTSA